MEATHAAVASERQKIRDRGAEGDPRCVGYGGTNHRLTGGTLTITDGTHTAKIALLGNYLSSTFVPTKDNFGGTIITDPIGATELPGSTNICSQVRISQGGSSLSHGWSVGG